MDESEHKHYITAHYAPNSGLGATDTSVIDVGLDVGLTSIELDGRADRTHILSKRSKRVQSCFSDPKYVAALDAVKYHSRSAVARRLNAVNHCPTNRLDPPLHLFVNEIIEEYVDNRFVPPSVLSELYSAPPQRVPTMFIMGITCDAVNPRSVCVRVYGTHPYLVIEGPRNLSGQGQGSNDDVELVKEYLSAIRSAVNSAFNENGVINVEYLTGESVWNYDPNKTRNFFKITVREQKLLYQLKTKVESGELSMNLESSGRRITFNVAPKQYEAIVNSVLRWTVDVNLVGCAVVTIPAAALQLVEGKERSTRVCAEYYLTKYARGYQSNVSNPNEVSVWHNVMKVYDFSTNTLQGLNAKEQKMFDDPEDHRLSLPSTIMPPVRMLAIDIECVTLKGAGFPSPETDPVIQISGVLSVGTYSWSFILTVADCAPIAGSTVFSFDDEAAMLAFCADVVVALDPDYITGYNVINFDLYYLYTRAQVLEITEFLHQGRMRANPFAPTATNSNQSQQGSRGDPNKDDQGTANNNTNANSSISANTSQLSPAFYVSSIAVSTIRKTNLTTKQLGTHESKDIPIAGRVQFDILEIIRREHKLKSYSLNAVSLHFLKQTKEDVHYSEMKGLFESGPEGRRRIAQYCIKDSVLVIRLIGKLCLLINSVEMARVCGVSVTTLLTRGQSVKVTSQLLRTAKLYKIFIPAQKRGGGGTDVQYEGATVLDPKKGFYEQPIATLDFASLYPSIMIAHNLCYTALLPSVEVAKQYNLTENDFTVTPANKVFVKTHIKQGLMTSVLKNLLAARKQAKRDMAATSDPLLKQVYDGRQLALKVSANSVYGYTGAVATGVLPCLAISESITAFGREMIDFTMKTVEMKFGRGVIWDRLKEIGVSREEMIQLERQAVAERNQNRQKALDSLRAETSEEKMAQIERKVALRQQNRSVFSSFKTVGDGKKGDDGGTEPAENGNGGDVSVDPFADVVYGDTDSVMVRFNLYHLPTVMRLGEHAAAMISAEFVNPIALEFEKVFKPFLLMNKKRYAGLMWTEPTKYKKLDCKGIETVRRDFSEFTQALVDDCLRCVMFEDSSIAVQKAAAMVRSRLEDLMMDRIDISHLVLSKSLSKEEYTSKLAHVVLAEKLRKRDPLSAPQTGDRVYYVVVAIGNAKAPQYDKAEDPLYVLENNLPIDVKYYIDAAKNPIQRILEPINPALVKEIFERDFAKKSHIATGAGSLMGFMKRSLSCLSCGVPIKSGGLCNNCCDISLSHLFQGRDIEEKVELAKPIQSVFLPNTNTSGVTGKVAGATGEAPENPASTSLVSLCGVLEDKSARVESKLNDLKSNYKASLLEFQTLWTKCQNCQSSCHQMILCTNRDCPIFYRRIKARKELEKDAEKIVRINGDLSLEWW